MEQQYSKNRQSQKKTNWNQHNLFSGLPDIVKTDHVHLFCDDNNNIGGDFSEINEHLPRCQDTSDNKYFITRKVDERMIN